MSEASECSRVKRIVNDDDIVCQINHWLNHRSPSVAKSNRIASVSMALLILIVRAVEFARCVMKGLPVGEGKIMSSS